MGSKNCPIGRNGLTTESAVVMTHWRQCWSSIVSGSEVLPIACLFNGLYFENVLVISLVLNHASWSFWIFPLQVRRVEKAGDVEGQDEEEEDLLLLRGRDSRQLEEGQVDRVIDGILDTESSLLLTEIEGAVKEGGGELKLRLSRMANVYMKKWTPENVCRCDCGLSEQTLHMSILLTDLSRRNITLASRSWFLNIFSYISK